MGGRLAKTGFLTSLQAGAGAVWDMGHALVPVSLLT